MMFAEIYILRRTYKKATKAETTFVFYLFVCLFKEGNRPSPSITCMVAERYALLGT